jgi:16S rRNA (uracil1498-N3)-methyltransferase
MQRYFVTKENDKFILSSDDIHHIKDVMRIKNNGQIVCVFNNSSYVCEVNYLSSGIDLKVVKEISNDVELNKSVILYQALIKNDKFDFVIQKACELGVSDIYPTAFTRSVVKVESNKVENKMIRYNKIIKEACEQSRRQILPTFHNYINVFDILLPEDTLGLIAYENNNNFSSFDEALKDLNQYKKVAIVIGPEGGFTSEEVKYLQKVGFKNISLGKRILRSETAAMYALSVVGFHLEGKK